MAKQSYFKNGFGHDIEDEILTTKEACAFLKISPRWLYQLRCEGKIRYKQMNRKVWFRKSELYEFIDRHDMPSFNKK